MKWNKKSSRVFSFILGFISLLLSACGGGSSNRFNILRQPVAIVSSSIAVPYDGRTTKLLYVANQGGGSVSILDQDKERILDADDRDDFDDSPIWIGGRPVALAVDDRGEKPRVFVADEENGELWAFEASVEDENLRKQIPHAALNLGGSKVVRSSTPVFRDRGRRSTPTISRILVGGSSTRGESWTVKYADGKGGFEVEGTVSGKQVAIAKEGATYRTDDERVEFLISGGGDPTTNDDTFRFGTVVGNPLALGATPVALRVKDHLLYILTKAPAEIVEFDLDSLTVMRTVALDDGSGDEALPTSLIVGEDRLWATNEANATFFEIDIENFTSVTRDISHRIRVGEITGNGETLYLAHLDERAVSLWNIEEEQVTQILQLTGFGLSMSMFERESIEYLLVGTEFGTVDVIRTDEQSRVDTSVSGRDVQSQAIGKEFYDHGARSSPDLVSVNLKDGVTKSERWQLIYEGVIPGAADLSFTLVGRLATLDTGDLSELQIKEGDQFVIDAERVLVEEISSPTTITLVSEPQTQGTVRASIRAKGQYVVIGSISGVQNHRVEEDTPYTNDDGAIALTIRSSRSNPTTEDDFFTFLAVDGIDPVPISNRRLARGIVSFIRPGKDEPTAYVTQEGSNLISVLNLSSWRERKTIR